MVAARARAYRVLGPWSGRQPRWLRGQAGRLLWRAGCSGEQAARASRRAAGTETTPRGALRRDQQEVKIGVRVLYTPVRGELKTLYDTYGEDYGAAPPVCAYTLPCPASARSCRGSIAVHAAASD